mgnify:CR=1 FL=1
MRVRGREEGEEGRGLLVVGETLDPELSPADVAMGPRLTFTHLGEGKGGGE